MRILARLFLALLMMTTAAVTCFAAAPTGMDAVRLMEQGKTKEAMAIFEGLAAKGDDKAMVQIGLYYYMGQGVKQDYPKAMDWFLKAFEKQNADAFVNIGVMHRDGKSVPANKKIAYCIFLTTHMCGLGSQSTQSRSNSCLRRLIDELKKEGIKDCLSNYTLKYMTAYIEARGKIKGIPAKFKPAKDNPAIKDLGWFTDRELDAIYGEPTAAEKKARKARAAQREREIDALRHDLVFQIKFLGSTLAKYPSYNTITDSGMSSGAIKGTLSKSGADTVFEEDMIIYAEQHRYITVKDKENRHLVYRIEHPVKASPTKWSHWQLPAFMLTDSMDTFTLLHGREPKSKSTTVPANAPKLRFKITKK